MVSGSKVLIKRVCKTRKAPKTNMGEFAISPGPAEVIHIEQPLVDLLCLPLVFEFS